MRTLYTLSRSAGRGQGEADLVSSCSRKPAPAALRQIRKTSPSVRALDNVNFTLRANEIHALLGENGAGKSTLIKVLTGAEPRDAGQILLDGNPISPRNPAHAQQLGI